SADQIREAITEGALDADKAIATLVEQMGIRFDGAAERVKKTWSGATDRIKGAWRDIGSDLMQPFISKEGGGAAVQWANDVADARARPHGGRGGWRRALRPPSDPAGRRPSTPVIGEVAGTMSPHAPTTDLAPIPAIAIPAPAATPSSPWRSRRTRSTVADTLDSPTRTSTLSIAPTISPAADAARDNAWPTRTIGSISSGMAVFWR